MPYINPKSGIKVGNLSVLQVWFTVGAGLLVLGSGAVIGSVLRAGRPGGSHDVSAGAA